MFHVEHLPGVCHAANSAGVNDGGKVRRSLQGAASPTPRGGCGRLPVNARYRASIRGGVKTPPYRWGSRVLHGKILLRCRGDHWSPANLPQQRIFRDSFLQGKRALMGNPRAGHARPLPRGSQKAYTNAAIPARQRRRKPSLSGEVQRVEKSPSAREVPRRGGGREPCHSPKYFGQPYSSLPHRLRAEPPRRGG